MLEKETPEKVSSACSVITLSSRKEIVMTQPDFQGQRQVGQS